jgi:hypothetical protein
MHSNKEFELIAQDRLYETPVASLFTLETEETIAKSNTEQIIDDDEEEDFDW